MSRTVFLHVGVAKTGTTYLQRILHSNRQLLKDNGALYPGDVRSSHFVASVDLRGGRFKGYAYPDAEGAWQRLVDEVNAYDGSALISHETLARTRKPIIQSAVESLDTEDVRVVLTTRDLARQVPAVWQERLKNGNVETYSAYLDSIFSSQEGRRRRGGFWQSQDLIGLTRRWADIVGPERVTIVTVPPPGDPDELWRRFARAVELPDLPYDLAVVSANSSLGVVEAELLRRLNSRLPELTWPEYEYRIKHRFAELDLAGYQTAGRIVVPEKWRVDVRRLSKRTIGYLRRSKCHVVGNLDDLRPNFTEAAAVSPDDVDDAVVLDLSLRVLGKFAAQPDPAPEVRPAPPRPAWRRLAGAVRRRARLRRG